MHSLSSPCGPPDLRYQSSNRGISQSSQKATLHVAAALLLDPNHYTLEKIEIGINYFKNHSKKSLFKNAPRALPKFAGSSLVGSHTLAQVAVTLLADFGTRQQGKRS